MSSLKFTRQLQDTGNPVWRLVESLNTPIRMSQNKDLFENDISAVDFPVWRPIIYASDIQLAVTILASRGYTVKEEHIGIGHMSQKLVPTWVVIYLACSKVRTSQHAHGALMDLVFSHLDAAPSELQGSLLIITAVALARFRMLVPIRRVVEKFLTIPLSYSQLQFNLLLQAMTRLPGSVQAADLVVMIINAMQSRQLRLESHTYHALLSDRHITMRLTIFLRNRMVQEGFVPTADHLEAYLRVFSKHGSIHESQEYFDAIRKDALKRNAWAPLNVDQSAPDASLGVPHPANSYLLASKGDRASAFEYLGKLLNAQKTLDSIEREKSLSLLNPLRSPATKQSRIPWKKTIDIYDWTTALASAADDPTTSVKMLVTFFERARVQTRTFRPTVVTYTVLLRGLYRRRVYELAETYWLKLLKTGLTIDRHALTIGMLILTRLHRPHEALGLLEKFGARSDTAFPAQYRLGSPILLEAIAVNEFFLALKRIHRPDIVFLLWEYMGDLYDFRPNDVSLNLLLQCARLSAKLDDSASGTFAQLALKNPFRTTANRAQTRKEVLDAFKQIAGDSKTGMRPYFSGVWGDMHATEKVRMIFQQVVLGNWPELSNVRPPAFAIRSSSDAQQWRPLAELAQGMGLPRNSPQPRKALPHDLLTHEGRSRYPGIMLVEANFFDYILLLGLTKGTEDIPLALAWMRALDITPSTTTIAVSMIFWAEVSMQAPLIEHWTGGEKKSQYGRFVQWITEWVGKKGLPNGHVFGMWLKRIGKMRDQRI